VITSRFSRSKWVAHTATPLFCPASHRAWRNQYGNKEEHFKEENCEEILIVEEVFGVHQKIFRKEILILEEERFQEVFLEKIIQLTQIQPSRR